MKHTEFKTKLVQCAMFDYRGMEQELTEMAAKGWQLESVNVDGLWTYRKTEPAEKDFTVVFCKDARYVMYGESKSQEELEEICANLGWEKVGQWKKMIIFSADKGTAEPLETDEYARLQSAKYALQNFIVLRGIEALLVGFFIWRSGSTLFEMADPQWYSGLTEIYKIIIWVGTLLYFAIEVGGFFFWVKKSEESIAAGGDTAGAEKISRAVYLLTKAFWCFLILTFAFVVVMALWLLRG